MRYLIILLLFFLANCSGYTIASLSTNVITYSATGKTNSDHVISFVTGKDCAITSTLKQQDYCQEKSLVFAENEEKNDSYSSEENINKEKKSYKKIAGKIIDSTYYVGKNVARDHAILGAKILDKMRLTNELEEKVKTKFDNKKIKKDLSQDSDENKQKKMTYLKNEKINKKNDNLKNDKINKKKDDITWKQKVCKHKDIYVPAPCIIVTKVEKAKVQKKEFMEETKVKSKILIEEAKVQKKEFMEETKVKSKILIEEAKVQKKELIEGVNKKKTN